MGRGTAGEKPRLEQPEPIQIGWILKMALTRLYRSFHNHTSVQYDPPRSKAHRISFHLNDGVVQDVLQLDKAPEVPHAIEPVSLRDIEKFDFE